nr:hypothetical protein [Deltaproteobacteria bacterium]
MLDATLPALKALPFHWVEAPPTGSHTEIEALTRDLRALHPEHDGKPVVLVVDFLQLVAGTDPREDTITRVSRASYACRAVARDHNAVVLVLSSVSRGNVALTRIEQRDADGTTSTPPAHDLVGMGKESGDVEYSADSVFVLCPEAWAEGEPPLPGGRAVHLAVAKVRAGRAGWHELRFDGSRFIEAPTSPLDGQAPAPRAWCSTCGDVVNVELHASGAFHACVDGHRIDGAVEPVERPLTKKERTEKARHEGRGEGRTRHGQGEGAARDDVGEGRGAHERGRPRGRARRAGRTRWEAEAHEEGRSVTPRDRAREAIATAFRERFARGLAHPDKRWPDAIPSADELTVFVKKCVDHMEDALDAYRVPRASRTAMAVRLAAQRRRRGGAGGGGGGARGGGRGGGVGGLGSVWLWHAPQDRRDLR